MTPDLPRTPGLLNCTSIVIGMMLGTGDVHIVGMSVRTLVALFATNKWR